MVQDCSRLMCVWGMGRSLPCTVQGDCRGTASSARQARDAAGISHPGPGSVGTSRPCSPSPWHSPSPRLCQECSWTAAPVLPALQPSDCSHVPRQQQHLQSLELREPLSYREKTQSTPFCPKNPAGEWEPLPMSSGAQLWGGRGFLQRNTCEVPTYAVGPPGLRHCCQQACSEEPWAAFTRSWPFCQNKTEEKKIWTFLSTETSHSLLQIKFHFLLFSLKPK